MVQATFQIYYSEAVAVAAAVAIAERNRNWLH